MAISKRGNSWLVSVSHRGIRDRQTFKSHDEARVYEAQVKADLMAGVYGGSSKSVRSGVPLTVGGMADHIWDLEWSKQKASDHTFNRMTQVVAHFGEKTLIESISSYTLEAYVLHLRNEGNGPATINRKCGIISKILSYAHRHGVIKVKPVIRKQREPDGRIRYYTEEEENKITDLMFDHDLRDFFIFLIDTGMRRGEALSVKWEDVDTERNQIVLADPDMIKASLPRQIPMTNRVADMMSVRREFGDQYGPFPFSRSKVDRMVEAFRLRSGYKGATEAMFHTCRHTFCSRLIQRGVPLTTVKVLAGHRDIKTTLRYSHLAPSNLTDAIAKLERS